MNARTAGAHSIMEIGDLETNVLYNNEFSSVDYLMIKTNDTYSDVPKLQSLENEWRKAYHLVIADASRAYVWVFGTAARLTKWEFTIDEKYNGNREEPTRIEWARGSYEPSLVYKSAKPNPTGSVVKTEQRQNASTVRRAWPMDSRTADSGELIPTENDELQDMEESSAEFPILSDREIHELFIGAVLASLRHCLTESGICVSINARTLGHRRTLNAKNASIDRTSRESYSIVTLDVLLTAQAAMILKVSYKCVEGLGSLDGCDVAAHLATGWDGLVCLGPIGRRGVVTGMHNRDHATPNFGDNALRIMTSTSPLSSAPASWKAACAEWLQDSGCTPEMLRSCQWVDVQIIPARNVQPAEMLQRETPITVQWPAPLCFFQRPAHKIQRNGSLCEYDPLAFAQRWCVEQSARDAASVRNAKQQEDPANKTEPQSLVNTTGTSTHPGHRSSVSGAMYPTPPDGTVPQSDVEPHSNSMTDTPAMSQVVDNGESNATTSAFDQAHDRNVQSWSGAIEVSNAHEAADHSNVPFDNLFEEMDGDLFGEDHDITDADFSFFDDTEVSDIPGVANPANGGSRHAEDELNNIQQYTADTANLTVPSDTVSDKADETEVAGRAKPALNHKLELITSESSPGQEIDIFTNEIVRPPARPLTPPLNPETVFKQLTAMTFQRSKAKEPKSSAFDGFEFNPSMPSFMSKYGSTGRFMSPIMPKTIFKPVSTSLPTTEYMSRRRKRQSVAGCDDMTPSSTSGPSPKRSKKTHRYEPNDLDSPTSSPGNSAESDQDDTSDTSDEEQTAATSSLPRRFGEPQTPHDESMHASPRSFLTELPDAEALADTFQYDEVLQIDPAEWSLDRYFKLPQHSSYAMAFDDSEYISLAQAIVDQAMSSNFYLYDLLPQKSADALHATKRSSEAEALRNDVALASEQFLGGSKSCTLSQFLTISDGANIAQHRIPPRSAPRLATQPEPPRPVFQLPVPQLSVTRADTKLTVNPAAIPFWETLGFGPSEGLKDIVAVCVHPTGLGLFENVQSFFDNIGNAYESNHLGTHERFSTAEFAYDFEEANNTTDRDTISNKEHRMTASLHEMNIRLGQLLTATELSEKNFVIYYAYHPAMPSDLLRIISSFQSLAGLYFASFAASTVSLKNSLVMQLVPLPLIASETTLVLPTPRQYSALAMEIYDRCSIIPSNMQTTPAITLERPLPRIIEFKLQPNPSERLLYENSVMHIAYAESLDSRWIVAAWTDNLGSTQYQASYCRSRTATPPHITSFTDIAAEIWATTIGILQSRRVSWRVMIVKSGAMEQHEMKTWQELAAAEHSAQVNMTLLTVGTDPSLQLSEPASQLPLSSILAGTPGSVVSTPAGTPGGILSPETAVNAATPGGLNAHVSTPTSGMAAESGEVTIEPGASLTDAREHVWGCVLAHRQNNSNCLLEIQPALISGYLVKRTSPPTTSGTSNGFSNSMGAVSTGTPTSSFHVASPKQPQGQASQTSTNNQATANISGGIAVMELNIVYSEVNPRLYEAFLKDIMMVYRDLSTLAGVRGKAGKEWGWSARGELDARLDVRPWHIIVAEKGVEALSLLL